MDQACTTQAAFMLAAQTKTRLASGFDQAAACEEVCTCGAERTATLLMVALPAPWRR